MPDITVSSSVDKLLKSDNENDIRSNIGLGAADVPSFGGLNLPDGVTFGMLSSQLKSSIAGSLDPEDYAGELTDSTFNFPSASSSAGKWYYLNGVSGTLTGSNAPSGIAEDGGYAFSDGSAWSLRGATPTNILDGSVTAAKTSFLTPTRNIFDISSITENTFLNAGNGNTSTNTTYFVSDFIEVQAGQTYFCKSTILNRNMRGWAAYDSSFVRVGAESSTDSGNTITVPASGVKYYKFIGYMDAKEGYQFELGAAQTKFIANGYHLDNTKIIPEVELPLYSNWAGKKFTSYGDSVTAGNYWQQHIVPYFDLDHTNRGQGGRRISGNGSVTTAMCFQADVDTIATDCELLIVMGGVNDWANNCPLGSPNSVDTNDFYGALNVMSERLTTRLPNCRIVYATTTYSEYADGNWQVRTLGNPWSSGAVNGAGLSSNDYAEAIRVVAKKWGFPIMDCAAEDGVNTVNVDAYRADDGNHFHHNEIGGKRTAETGIKLLSSLAPLS
jgi:hypothetical protein